MKENTSEKTQHENSTLCMTKVLEKHSMNSLNFAFSKTSVSKRNEKFSVAL